MIIMGISSDKWYEDEIVLFDRTHISMFSAPRTDKGSRKYVGALVESIKCQVVDKSLPVSNTNGHQSTTFQLLCPGESCSGSENCLGSNSVSRRCKQR
jgi:hypothetical protein